MTTMGMYVFAIAAGLSGAADAEPLARALRRAVMARVQGVLGGALLAPFFTGHELDGSPARAERSSHLAFLCDLPRSRFIVVAPHVLDRREPMAAEASHLGILEQALAGMCELRAAGAGRLLLRRTRIELDADPLTVPACRWQSATPYVVSRHARLGDAYAALAADLVAECRRRGLPAPVAAVALDARGVAGRGLSGHARLEFRTAVPGPLLLGRQRYLGGGLFLPSARAGSQGFG